MIISHKYRYVFAEIPHTASHSIAHQLLKHYGGEQIHRHHSNITIFMGQADAKTRGYFKFASIRNPLDTAVTDYNKLLGNHKGQYTKEAALLRNGGFVTEQHLREFDFIHDNNADFPTFFRKFRNKLYNNWFLIGHRHYDHIIRFESLQDSFAQVLRKLGIEQVEAVGHTNPTRMKKKVFGEYYTPDVYGEVARSYGPFLQKWGYGFPSEWGDLKIPLTSTLQFRALDGAANLAANHFTIDQDNRALSRIKQALDKFTSR